MHKTIITKGTSLHGPSIPYKAPRVTKTIVMRLSGPKSHDYARFRATLADHREGMRQKPREDFGRLLLTGGRHLALSAAV